MMIDLAETKAKWENDPKWREKESLLVCEISSLLNSMSWEIYAGANVRDFILAEVAVDAIKSFCLHHRGENELEDTDGNHLKINGPQS